MAAEAIAIGRADGRKVRLSGERRSTHLHVMGASGQGKSKFLEHCIREDILAGHGVCLIDPEGDLYESIVAWCASLRLHETMHRRRVHLFDPTRPDWRFQFNPLFVHPEENPGDRVLNVQAALEQVWGGEDSRGTPTIRITVQAILDVLLERGHSMAEAFYLTSTADPDQITAYLTHGLEDHIAAELWEGYRHMSETAKREHIAEFGGSRRRFAELLRDERIREVLAAYHAPIDFQACMDNGDIVLINLSPAGMGEAQARTFGALFVREMFHCASRRNPAAARERPFYAYIDECGSFLTSDITEALARARKRGFHLILAHQWLEQLREQSEAIYQGVMSIQNKVIFGGLKDEDALIMADELFRTEYDLEQPIAELTKPGVVGYERTWLRSWSESSGASDSEAVGTNDGETTGDVTGVATTCDAFGWPFAATAGQPQATTRTDARSGTRSEGRTTTNVSVTSSTSSEGASEALNPVLADQTGGVHSLENVRHLAVARLRSIPARHAVVKGAATPSFDVATFDVSQPAVTDRLIERFTTTVLERSPYTIPADQAREQLRAHQQQLITDARTFSGGFVSHPVLELETEDDGLG